ncbi:16S rRNA (uracil(1498)-N(3))-methyltransferase [Erythrobacteraceae bacterium WH01K]|nr:16S rRNA (uracil(1498)-N(3))-methyltransferase [Erythrobacteraceae bacterium WH01K]
MPATPAWPPRSSPRLFVDTPVGDETISIEGNQAHYLTRVMRISPGDAVVLCDDATGEWACEVKETSKRSVLLEPVRKLREREAVPDVWLCPALLKKDRFDLVLEKATELGVARIRPIVARRSVADKLNLGRARTVTTEAAEQCARTALPVLDNPVSLKDLLKAWPEDRALFFADELGGADAASSFSGTAGPAAILVGPEGGWDDAEREAIRAHPSARPISLGPRILRGETAAIAALSIWMATAGDWPHRQA